MAKTIVIDIQADTKSAKTNIEELTDTIEEQNKVLLDFEKELLEVNQKLESTSKSNLQTRKKLIDQRKQLQRGIKEQRLSLKGLNAEKRVSSRETKKLGDETKNVTGLFDSLSGGMISGFKKAAGASKFLTLGLKGVAGGIAATGIGAFVVAFGLLVTYFTQTQQGADILEKALAKIGTVFTVLIDRASSFGKGLFEMLSGNWDVGLDILKKSLEGVGDEIAREVKQTGELKDALVLLEEQEIEFIKTKALKEKQIAKSRAAAEDELKTDEERIRLTRLAIALEKELLDEELRIATERARIISEETGQGESKNEELRKEAEAIAKVSEVETKRFNRLRTLQADLNSLIGDSLDDTTDEEEDTSLFDIELADNRFENQQKLEVNEDFLDALFEQGLAANLKEEKAEKDRNKRIAALKKQQRDNNFKATLNGLSALSNLNSLFEGKTEEQRKKSFKRGKALNIASALIETYLSASKAFTSQIIPLDPTSPVRGAIAAAAAVAGGLARVNQIRKQKYQGSSSDGGGGGGGGGASFGSAAGAGFQASTPTISAIPTFNPNQNNNQNNVRAYVVQNDISNQNALDKRIRQRATL